MVPIPLIGISLLYRSHERHEFAWNNPINISIFNSLIELILLHVECTEIVPLELDGVLQPLKALKHRTLVQAVALARITIRLEEAVVWAEHVPSLLCCALQDNNHESTHKERSIHHLVRLI